MVESVQKEADKPKLSVDAAAVLFWFASKWEFRQVVVGENE